MNILVLGDVVGAQGCEHIRRVLPAFKKLKAVDLCIANGENSATGNGITPFSAQHLFASGVDLITTGNHAFKRREAYELFSEREDVLRPANYPDSCPGSGVGIIDLGFVRVGVINLLGGFGMNCISADNPFRTAEKALALLDDCKIILVDFHAEATSEKRALGFYLDGRVSAVFGTHTHVQTADEQILPASTGYITDLGMSGPVQSVLGVEKEIVIDWMTVGLPVRFITPEGPCSMCGCLFEIDRTSGKTLSVERVCVEE